MYQVYQLYLLVLKEWLYIESGVQWHNPPPRHPSHQRQVLQWYSLCGLHVPSCCGWATIDVSVLVCRAGPRSRSHFGGAWFQLGPPTRCGGVGAALGGTGPRDHWGGVHGFS